MADLPRFDLGQAGVVLTSSPLHGDPSQLTTGQNIEFIRASGLGGVGSRGPLKPFTSSQMLQQDGVTPGPVLAAVEVPLPSPLDAGLSLMILYTTAGYRSSRNGTTFTAVPLGVIASNVGAAFHPTTGAGAYVGPFAGGNTTVVVNNQPVTVVGDVQSIVWHPNGKVYVSVITSGKNNNQTARLGYSGSTYTLTPPQVGSTPVTGKVIQIDYPSLVQTQVGESFGGSGHSKINAFDFALQDGIVTGANPIPIGPTGAAPGPLAIGSSGHLYVAYGVYFDASAGSHISDDVRLGVDYLAIDPNVPLASWRDIGITRLGIPFTWFGTNAVNQQPKTCQPSLLIADTFTTDTPWWGSWAQDPFAVSSTIGLNTGSHAGGEVDSSYATSTKQFFDPQGGSLPDFGGFIQPIMFASKLFLAYVSYTSFGSDPGTVKIYRASANDASTLVEDINVLTAVISGPNGGPIPNHHCYPGQPYLFKTNGIDNDLYWPFYAPPVSGNSGHGFLLKRNAAGTWFVVVIDVPFAGPALSFSIQA